MHNLLIGLSVKVVFFLSITVMCIMAHSHTLLHKYTPLFQDCPVTIVDFNDCCQPFPLSHTLFPITPFLDEQGTRYK